MSGDLTGFGNIFFDASESTVLDWVASNPAAEENAAWIQLIHLSQQFPEIWDFFSIQIVYKFPDFWELLTQAKQLNPGRIFLRGWVRGY